MANFVRSPPSAGAEAAGEASSEPSENSAQAIKRVLERKAHNDAVRKREFAQLRKLRHATSEEAIKLVARDSFFLESSGFSVLEERASTLKKIDEIEAQMSKQWWKNRQDAAAAEPMQPMTAPGNALTDIPSEIDTRASFAATVPTDLDGDGTGMPTAPGQGESQFNRSSPGRASAKRVAAVPSRMFELTGNSAFSVSNMVSIEMGQTLSDPTLEDAAIRFANGDDNGAEAVLLEAMRAGGAQPTFTDTWASALFDLYRGTGQQQRFDQFALEYAQRFGRTAPVWYSTPAQLQAPGGGAVARRDERAQGAAWVCPARLDLASLEQLDAALRVGVGAGTVHLDWRQIDAVPPDVLPKLAELMARCCDQPLLLHWQGDDALTTFLRVHTPVGNNRVDPMWWKLRLDLLRVLSLQADFEMVAMDYCITYEVSPPSWQAAKSRRTSLPHSAADASDYTVTVRNALDTPQVELSGELKGDVTARLQALHAAGMAGGALQVDCERLIRVDFAAAGSILNWVTTSHRQGQSIEFAQAPRLVAGFFSLIGINEHARIMVRAN